MMVIEEFPWTELLHMALGTFRLTPQQFWNMTLPELVMMIEAREGKQEVKTPLQRAELEALQRSFPDVNGEESRGEKC
jgi:uncharacterized phage protein (TIGR02216 family)